MSRDNIPATTRELLEMHAYCRPAGSRTEAAFIARYLDSLPGVRIDKAGNRIARIGTAPVLWSSHTDTAHAKDGAARLSYGGGLLTLAPGEKASCLGADCTVGVWLMRHLYLARVPGLYIWHAAEEIGGIGSDHIARETPDILAGIQWAIALDRRGTGDVITHQGGVRTASESFTNALADALGDDYAPDDGGTFTDTANYAHLVPECTNISVGYYQAHTARECLAVDHAVQLLGKLRRLNVAALPVARDPIDRYADNDSPGADLLHLVENDPETAAEMLAEYGITPAEFHAASVWRLRR